jgi:predicted CopG family antitoxin
MKSITIKDETWQELTMLKARLIATSIDDVIKALLDGFKKA